jgi:hypothetical protein
VRWILPVKVLGGADGDEGVGVGEGGEDTDPERSVSIPVCRVMGFAAYSLEFSNWARTAMVYGFVECWLVLFVVRKEVVGESVMCIWEGRRSLEQVCCNSAIFFARIFVRGRHCVRESSTPARFPLFGRHTCSVQSHAAFHLLS